MPVLAGGRRERAGVGLQTVSSWTNIMPAKTRLVAGSAGWRTAVCGAEPLIPRGAGRSHGDCAYVGNGVSCTSQGLDAMMVLDEEDASVWVGAGASIGGLHRYLGATRFEFPVFGGTQWATIGGAIAGDIHGKNHATVGSFGNHVRELTLLTASGERISCGPDLYPELFTATIGGLGLTGFIESARLKLAPARSRTVHERREVVVGFERMRDRFASAGAEFSQAVWFDLAHREGLGLFCSATRVDLPAGPPMRTLYLPLPRVRMVTPATARLATAALFRAYERSWERLVDISTYNYSGAHELFFHWNRLYGGAGMIEFQFALPGRSFWDWLEELVRRAQRLSVPLLSAVVKRLGPVVPVGMLSFPMPGYTLSVQTPYRASTVRFLGEFTYELAAAGGRVNLTKDVCADAHGFAAMYGNAAPWRAVAKRYDPGNRISSNMSRRLEMKQW